MLLLVLLLHHVLILHAHLTSTSAFLTALICLTLIFLGNFGDWLVRHILLHALWDCVTLIVLYVLVFNIDDAVYNFLMAVGFT